MFLAQVSLFFWAAISDKKPKTNQYPGAESPKCRNRGILRSQMYEKSLQKYWASQQSKRDSGFEVCTQKSTYTLHTFHVFAVIAWNLASYLKGRLHQFQYIPRRLNPHENIIPLEEVTYFPTKRTPCLAAVLTHSISVCPIQTQTHYAGTGSLWRTDWPFGFGVWVNGYEHLRVDSRPQAISQSKSGKGLQYTMMLSAMLALIACLDASGKLSTVLAHPRTYIHEHAK